MGRELSWTLCLMVLFLGGVCGWSVPGSGLVGVRPDQLLSTNGPNGQGVMLTLFAV